MIVAGGRARRMGGEPKGLLDLAGRPVLAHVIERIAPHCTKLVLSLNRDPARFAGFGLAVVADDPVFAGAGPLAGILAGLDWVAAKAPAALLALTVPGDTPGLPTDLVPRLVAGRAAADVPIAACRSGGRRHPLVALWPIAARGRLRALLAEDGSRSVEAAMGRIGVTWVDWPAVPVDPFLNINTPQDLAAARRALAPLA